MMTEMEASEKYCPMRQPQTGSNCIGKKCAMWRFGKRPEPLFIRAVAQDAPTDEQARKLQGNSHGAQPPKNWEFYKSDDPEHPTGWHEPSDSAMVRRKGYCGLAGNPVA